MSLVGSLEDLGLGDILQIVSLSRKSGRLLLRSEEGEGRIVFRDGLVRAAFVKGEAEDLRALLLAGGFITEEEFDRAAETAEAHGDPVADVLARAPNFSKERLDSLRREQVERSVFRMFGWKTGEFSFEIRDRIDDRDLELLLPTGINSQYLTMEATRLGDEGEKDGDDDIEFGTIDDSAEGEAAAAPDPDVASDSAEEPPEPESEVGAPVVAPEAGRSRVAEALAQAAVRRVDSPAEFEDSTLEDSISEPPVEPALARADDSVSQALPGGSAPFAGAPPEPEVALVAEPEVAGFSEPEDAEIAEPEIVDVGEDEVGDAAEPEIAVVAESEEAGEASAAEAEPEERKSTKGAEARPVAHFASLVLIDPDLTALEWQKSVLGPICQRIHIFQRADGGISRIRQYLRRGEEPVVLVSDNVPGDPMNGISDPIGLIRRLRAHDPRMPIFLVKSRNDSRLTRVADANGLLQRPPNHRLANRRAWIKLGAEGEALREGLRNSALEQREQRVPPGPAPEAAASGAGDDRAAAAKLLRLKQMSDRLRDPSVRGEVLSLILEFAAESFSRVAIFMVRDDDAVGMAQAGLARADGPVDDTFREVTISADEPAWFRAVLESREGVKAPPRNEGDHKLAALLGSAVPREAYVAPIESSHRVVALVYGDNLPGDEPIGETTSLEIVLHEAGLALERALLERALADVGERDGA
jgi:hypothetical protein